MLLDLLDPEDFPFFLRPGLDLILVDFNTANIVFVDGVVALLVKGTLMISLTAAFVVTFGANVPDDEEADEEGGAPVNDDEVEVVVVVDDDFFDFFFFQNLSTFKVLYFDENIALTPVLSKATKSKLLLLLISDFEDLISTSLLVLVGTGCLDCLTTTIGSEGSEVVSSSSC